MTRRNSSPAARAIFWPWMLVWLLAAVAGLETWSGWLHRAEDRALQGRAAELQARIRDQRKDLTGLLTQVRLWEGARPAPAGETEKAGTAAERAVDRWIDQLNRTQKFFAEHPDQGIPEMSLLSPSDWLRLSREVRFDDSAEDRKALASFRNEARSRLSDQLESALGKYVTTHDGMLPESANDLAGLLSPGVDPALLDRYRLLVSGRASDAAGLYLFAEQGPPADERYDNRWYFGIDAPHMVQTWLGGELQDARQEAQLAFTRSHDGAKPKDTADLVPFVTSPLYREYFAATAAFTAAKGGKAQSLADVLPYLTSDEARALAERVYRR